MSMERRPITAAPGHMIDRAGQVYRVTDGQAVLVPANARGILRLHHGKSVITADRRTLLAVAFPDLTDGETRVPELAAPDPEPESTIDEEPAVEEPRRRRRRNRDDA